nr:dihydrolipoyl dehydrogenase [Planctomycetota bacterium]
AGPGGFRAAKRCAQAGCSVACIEKEFIGGTCLNVGCIPSKALLSSAHALLSAKSAAQIGIDIPTAAPNWPNIQQRKNAIVAGFRKGMTGSAGASNITMIYGQATVPAPGRVSIQTDEGSSEIEAGKIILATGSEPIELPNIPFDGAVVLSSKEVLSLGEVPQSLAIVGGGVIGCEMACVYAAMGTKVSIIEALPQLVPMEDEWVARLITREFKKLGIVVVTGQEVTSVDKTATLAKVVLENGNSIEVEKVLVSVGRKSAIDPQIVENLGLEMNSQSVSINEKLETNVPGVYAIGDLVGTTFLAHGATAEANVAAENATGGERKMGDYASIPRVIFTFPEIASVGKSEQTCTKQGLDVCLGKGFFKANGRSVAQNETAGQVRVVRDKTANKIVGVTIVGFMATEFVTLAASYMGTTGRLDEITYPHPTISETLEDAVQDAFARK